MCLALSAAKVEDRMVRSISLTRSWHVLVRIGIATIAVAAATALQLPVEIEVPGEPFLLNFVIVIMAAVAFGRVPGFFAVVESTIASLLFAEPGYSFKVTHAIDLLVIEIYAVVAALSVEAICRLVDGALAEKSEANSAHLLLREMKHRVANDLAAVAATLSVSTTKSLDTQSREIFRQTLNQVQIFSFVHRELSLDDSRTSNISSKVFVERLGKILKETVPRDIEAVFEHADNEFSLSQSQAVTLGLIINELVTNSLKYAFQDRRGGRIDVVIHEHLGDCYLRVSDNGCGFEGNVKGTGQGIKLLSALTQNLEGVLDLHSSSDGTTASIRFPICPATSRKRRVEYARAPVH
jgi:two-component sensor histidine kinase